ncbi:cysteine hydrolase family protein [Halalkalibacterium ligniniphilum]|uniref:cysteine hydrolase family protein n=1 Tax=Halalkalibacterium ligniniphilum TaxID=1134413 RepID=UPI0003475923|nr:isochorismatase family cysteine hydrolase [Halalkalibacterium ligniniphilum]
MKHETIKLEEAKAKSALIVIDMISDFEFEDGEKLFQHALPAAKKIAKLKERAKSVNVPVIYVNDNYGKWQSDFRQLIEHCLKNDVRGRSIAEILMPNDDDFFILKPSYSGFFQTPLELLLHHLGIKNLIITGVAGNMCVQFTANDAYMRDYTIVIPKDTIASNSEAANQWALHIMEEVLKADIKDIEDIKLG